MKVTVFSDVIPYDQTEIYWLEEPASIFRVEE
jgi:hypothetical protein